MWQWVGRVGPSSLSREEGSSSILQWPCQRCTSCRKHPPHCSASRVASSSRDLVLEGTLAPPTLVKLVLKRSTYSFQFRRGLMWIFGDACVHQCTRVAWKLHWTCGVFGWVTSTQSFQFSSCPLLITHTRVHIHENIHNWLLLVCMLHIDFSTVTVFYTLFVGLCRKKCALW